MKHREGEIKTIPIPDLKENQLLKKSLQARPSKPVYTLLQQVFMDHKPYLLYSHKQPRPHLCRFFRVVGETEANQGHTKASVKCQASSPERGGAV